MNYDHEGAALVSADRFASQRRRSGDWHGVQAMKAYRRKDYQAYIRHARIAELLWKEVEQ